jgi:hypothetical protein
MRGARAPLNNIRNMLCRSERASERASASTLFPSKLAHARALSLSFGVEMIHLFAASRRGRGRVGRRSEIVLLQKGLFTECGGGSWRAWHQGDEGALPAMRRLAGG